MMKRLYLLLMCLLSVVGVKAEELTVHDGTETNEFIPLWAYACSSYIKSEFVIPAAELTAMAGGNINAMTFYLSTPASGSFGDARFCVYMKEVNDTTISTFSSLDDATIVYEDSLDGTQSTMTINFTTPYTYRGGHLLIGIYNTSLGDYQDCEFYGETTPYECALSSFGDYPFPLTFLPKTTFSYIGPPAPSDFVVSDVADESALLSWTSHAAAWQICLNGDEEHPIDVSTNPYTLTNLQSGTPYTVKVRTNYGDGRFSRWSDSIEFATAHCTPENLQTISYVLTDDYGMGWYYSYIKVVHRNTGIVMAKLFGKDHGLWDVRTKEEGTLNLCCGETYDFFWVTSYAGYDRDYGYAFYDLNGDEIISFEPNGENAPPAGLIGTYTVDCSVNGWKTPTHFEAKAIYGGGALLNWTENGPATAWVVAYKAAGEADFTEVAANGKPFTLFGLNPETQYMVKVRPVTDDGTLKWSKELSFTTDVVNAVPKNMAIDRIGPHSAVINWDSDAPEAELQYASARGPLYYYDNGVFSASYGLNVGSTTWGVKFPAGSIDGNTLSKVSVGEYDNATCTLTIYNGGDTAPANPVATKSIAMTKTDDWLDISFENVAIDNSKNLWVVLSYVGNGHPAACCEYANSNPNGRWFYYNGVWWDYAALNSDYANVAWMIRAEITTDGNPSSRNWVTVSGATSPYTLTGLNTDNPYEVRVRAKYDNPVGDSEWVTGSFRTSNENPALCGLEAVPLSTTASIRWTGFSDRYKVRYRMKSHIDVGTSGFSDGFENGLGKWTVVLNGEGNKYTNWQQFAPSDFYSPLSSNHSYYYYDTDHKKYEYTSHSGNCVAMSRSFNGYDIIDNVDNWLISPQIALNDTLSFWVADDGDLHDICDVYVSTTTNDISSFVKVYEPGNASFEWKRHAIDLSSYNGAMGYIAFRYTSLGSLSGFIGAFLYIDDVAVGQYVPASQWVEVTTNEPFVRLAGLNSGAPYEYQIVGIKDGYQDIESEIATFTTLDADALPEIALYANQDNAATLAAHDGENANVTLNDYTLSADGTWSTLCLPFSMSAEQIAFTPLAGYTIKELDLYTEHRSTGGFGFDFNIYDDYTGFDITSGNLFLYLQDANGIEAGKPYLIRKPKEEEVLYGVTYTATAGSAGFTVNEGYDGLVDAVSGDYRKKWCTHTGLMTNGVWFSEFNVNTPVNVTEYVLTTGNDTYQEPGRNPAKWVLKAKRNAGDEWITIDSRNTIDNPADALPGANATDVAYSIALDKQGIYQYFRYEVSETVDMNVGKMQLYELKLKGAVAGQGIENPRFPDVVVSSAAPTTLVSRDGKLTFQGTYAPLDFPANDLRTLFLKSNGTLDYLHANTTLGTFGAYFHAAASPSFKIIDGDTTTTGDIYDKQRGDVNLDGFITLADLTYLVDTVRLNSFDRYFDTSDVNGDNKVNSDDILRLVDTLLGK